MADDIMLTSEKLKGFVKECECTREGTMCPSTGRLVHDSEFGTPAHVKGWFLEFMCEKSGLWFARPAGALDAIRQVLRDNGIEPK